MRVGALCHLQRAFSAILHGELKRVSNLAAQPLPTWSLSRLLKHGDSLQSSERLSGWRTKSSHTWIDAAPISCRGKVCSDIKQSVSISVPETAGMMSGPHRGSGAMISSSLIIWDLRLGSKFILEHCNNKTHSTGGRGGGALAWPLEYNSLSSPWKPAPWELAGTLFYNYKRSDKGWGGGGVWFFSL